MNYSLFCARPSAKIDHLVHFQMVYNWTLFAPPLDLKDLIFTEYVCMQDVKLVRPKMHFLQCPLGLPCPRCLPLRLFWPFWRTNNHFSMEAVTPSWDKNVFWCWFLLNAVFITLLFQQTPGRTFFCHTVTTQCPLITCLSPKRQWQSRSTWFNPGLFSSPL